VSSFACSLIFGFHKTFSPKEVGKKERMVLECLLVIWETDVLVPRTKDMALVAVDKN
jgi:hypothetical protein